MAKLNKICCVCKRSYHYCPTCLSDMNKPTWMGVFCCENCRDVYNTLNDYRYKKLSKEEALQKLEKLDLSETDKLPSNFKDMLNEILSLEFKKAKSQEKEDTIDDSILEDFSVGIIDQENETVENDLIDEIKKPKPKKKAKVLNSDF